LIVQAETAMDRPVTILIASIALIRAASAAPASYYYTLEAQTS
jgi:hypothetical protein